MAGEQRGCFKIEEYHYPVFEILSVTLCIESFFTCSKTGLKALTTHKIVV